MFEPIWYDLILLLDVKDVYFSAKLMKYSVKISVTTEYNVVFPADSTKTE